MDIQKDTAFNEWFESQCHPNAVRLAPQRAWAWYAWQTAKAQTVPEGFVVVEKKLIKTLHEELLDHEPDSFVVIRDICELWEQAEAQEPAKAKAVPEATSVGDELQSWVAVNSFAASDAVGDFPIIDANALAEVIEKLTGANQ